MNVCACATSINVVSKSSKNKEKAVLLELTSPFA